jgi:DNA repair protein RadA
MKFEDTDLTELTKIKGISDTIAKKVFDAGIPSMKAVSRLTINQFKEQTGIGEGTSEKIIVEALKKECVYKSGLEMYDEQGLDKKLSMGCTNFDELMGGGIRPRVITEFHGEFGSAKTQFCHQLAVNVQLPPHEKSVIYIDTENTFSPKRIKEMADHVELDYRVALDKILVIRIFNSEHLQTVIETLGKLIRSMDAGLVVVDSLIAHFRVDYQGRGTLGARQQKLNKCIHLLKKHADINNIPVIVTNQVMSSPGVMYGDPTKALGGHVLGHAAAYRLYLTKKKGGVRKVKLIDSPDLDEGLTEVKITQGGIVNNDADDK